MLKFRFLVAVMVTLATMLLTANLYAASKEKKEDWKLIQVFEGNSYYYSPSSFTILPTPMCFSVKVKTIPNKKSSKEFKKVTTTYLVDFIKMEYMSLEMRITDKNNETFVLVSDSDRQIKKYPKTSMLEYISFMFAEYVLKKHFENDPAMKRIYLTSCLERMREENPEMFAQFQNKKERTTDPAENVIEKNKLLF
jgi:hypothetical protein